MIGIGTPNSQSKIPRPINHPLIATLRAGRLLLPDEPVCPLSYSNEVGWRLRRSREEMQRVLPRRLRCPKCTAVSKYAVVHHEIYDACP